MNWCYMYIREIANLCSLYGSENKLPAWLVYSIRATVTDTLYMTWAQLMLCNKRILD